MDFEKYRRPLAEKVMGWVAEDVSGKLEYPVCTVNGWAPDVDAEQAVMLIEAWANKTSGDYGIRRRAVAGRPAYNIHLEPWPLGEGEEVHKLFYGPITAAICHAIVLSMGLQPEAV